MKATDLQHSLAHLAPGETLLLPAIEIEQAFPFGPNREVWLAEVTNLRVVSVQSHTLRTGREPDPLHPTRRLGRREIRGSDVIKPKR
jgi:hypothetical protein